MDCRKLKMLCLLTMGIFVSFAWQQDHAAGNVAALVKPKKQAAAETQKQETTAARFTPEQIDAISAALPDGAAKDEFLKGIAAAEQEKAKPQSDVRTGEGAGVYYHEGVSAISLAKKRLLAYLTHPASESEEWKAAFKNINNGEGFGHLLRTVLAAILIIAIGLFGQRMVKRATQPLQRQILERAHLGRLRFLGRVLSNFLLNLMGFAAYVIITFLVSALLYDQTSPAYRLIGFILLPSYYIKFFILMADLGLSPKAPALRLFPVRDEDAFFLYRWIVLLSVTGIVIATMAYLFKNAGIGQQHFDFLYALSGAAVNLLLIVMLWRSRNRVARAIWPGNTAGEVSQGTLREKFARCWHYFAIAYVIVIGIYWFVNALAGRGAILELITTLFLVPLFIGIDQWVQKLLKIATGELPEVIDLSGDALNREEEKAPDEEKKEIRDFAPLISKVFRAVLLICFFFTVLKLWGINLPLGRILSRSALGTVGALMLGYIGWQYIKTLIDRKLEEEGPVQHEEMEEGGAGGSRSATLLMLLRKFVLAVMVVMVSLIVLSSLGVNIAPLIAGAGVVGLAIGFGAQTLVKDIISGIFFLVDDAFRVGDYIETAGTKGMVEHISLRSLRLRHPRGPVFTIPFGDMGTVKNNSRDYIIEKLDFRVRYDTDVNKVRKIIKRINKEIQNDKEMGPVMLGKLKSQGVRELDDSAMVMRVKFKTIPGEQFVVRRVVFQRMQEAFHEAGIEFAHRNVTVYLPPQLDENGDQEGKGAKIPPVVDQKTLDAAGAAAVLATEKAEEEEKKD